jgi:2-amino-4-hydroxy-6-hydroxymethyldihydropteridine diphosphokinase
MSGRDAYVALGSNLGDRRAFLEGALAALDESGGVRVLACSRFYETEPVGPPPQGPYLNAVARLETELAPAALLSLLLELEARAGRERGAVRNAPRTLDLDLLLHGRTCVEEDGLELPHPRMHERAFVLEPLCEIAPDLVHPRLRETIRTLAARAREPGKVRALEASLGRRRTAWPSSP